MEGRTSRSAPTPSKAVKQYCVACIPCSIGPAAEHGLLTNSTAIPEHVILLQVFALGLFIARRPTLMEVFCYVFSSGDRLLHYSMSPFPPFRPLILSRSAGNMGHPGEAEVGPGGGC